MVVAYLPAAQVVHVETPAAELNLPSPHWRQTVLLVAPTLMLNVPALHVVHEPWPGVAMAL